jgi:hypothetical protein
MDIALEQRKDFSYEPMLRQWQVVQAANVWIKFSWNVMMCEVIGKALQFSMTEEWSVQWGKARNSLF